MHLNTTCGRRLAQIRLARGLSQRQVGAAVGRSRQTVAGREAKDRLLPRTIGQLTKALGRSVADLMAPFDAPIPPAAAVWWRRRRRHTISPSWQP